MEEFNMRKMKMQWINKKNGYTFRSYISKRLFIYLNIYAIVTPLHFSYLIFK